MILFSLTKTKSYNIILTCILNARILTNFFCYPYFTKLSTHLQKFNKSHFLVIFDFSKGFQCYFEKKINSKRVNMSKKRLPIDPSHITTNQIVTEIINIKHFLWMRWFGIISTVFVTYWLKWEMDGVLVTWVKFNCSYGSITEWLFKI